MKQKTYLRWGVTITAAACAILVFYDTFFQDGVLFIFIEKLFGILKPVLYGLAMAYLLTPIVDFFDRLLRDRLGVKRAGLMRCLSILVTWLLALGLVYLLFSILIPELVDWVKNTVIPGAQVAIVAVTGGVLSVLVFAKDLLVGIVVSVYILARKETFGLHTRKLLYSLVSAPHYERALRATREADRIFSGFVRGKLLDSLIIGILSFIVCSILKFPYTPIIAVFVGVTNIIPIFGPFLGAIPSAFLILLVSPRQCLYFIIFIIALQQFDGNILGPKILGETVGISSFWIVVAILVGGGFGGVLGMFLGVPVFACIHSAVSFLCESSLRKKGVTDDTIFAPRRVLTGTTTTPKGESHE